MDDDIMRLLKSYYINYFILFTLYIVIFYVLIIVIDNNYSSMTGVTSGAGIVYPSGATKFYPGLLVGLMLLMCIVLNT